MARKTFQITLLKGFSFTTADGRTFYQNRPLKAQLDDLEADRMRSMENGTKFQIIVPPRAATAQVEEAKRTPVTDDAGDAEVSVDLSHFETMTVGELKEYLDEFGIDYPSGSRKVDLVKLASEV